MKMIKPLGDQVLLKRYKEEKKPGMLIVPDSEDKTDIFIILDVGSIAPDSLDIGDHVLLKKYSGQSYKFGDKEFILVSAEDILAKVFSDPVPSIKIPTEEPIKSGFQPI